MSKNIVPLDANKHKNICIKPKQNYAHASNQHIVPLVAAEYLSAAGNFPIVFVKQQDTGQFKSVALMGFEQGENVFFSQGKINTSYVPVHFRRQPFSVAGENSDDENMVLCIDLNSDLIANEGIALFDEDGKPSETTNNVSTLLVDLIAREKATDLLIATLVKYELLQDADLKVNLGEQGERKIAGLYKVNEEALHQLDDEVVLDLYKRKYFSAIYSHLTSLSQFKRLLQLKSSLDSDK